ncbi:tetra-peptide repeat homeobox protein 1-like [Plakobranchus ocellatus]|uniref:Tetra-peptide repeat homeobox protein 1-like n=1 Tax=Plakobranchus ocellatus TaxID=259542 RepID=A0AAV3YXW1_9GAST|nr:tetra-peptide repeat homeobox protein 1-like [Plakobranchus ocellatus]
MHQLGLPSPKMVASLKINHVETQIELDKGSAFSVMTVDDYKEIEYSDALAQGIREIKNVEANIRIKHGSNSKFLKAHTVPYALKPMLEKKLDKLECEGIINQTDKSKWATPKVPVLKKNGNASTCGDYKVTLNKFWKRNTIPYRA